MINGGQQELPPDAVLIKQIGTLNFYFSKTQHAFFIETEGYHAGLVKFSKTEIMELLSIFDNQTEEKEKNLLSELETDDDDFL